MKRQQGIALVISLLVSMLLVMLSTAFFHVNRGNLMTAAAAFKQRRALLAAQSGIAWVRSRLEANQDYARLPFDQAASYACGDMLVTEQPGEKRVSGSFSTQQGRDNDAFSVRIYNNLGGVPPVGATLNGQYVPPDAVHLHVEGVSGGFKTALEVVYAGEPLYDASAVSHGNLDMQGAPYWHIASKDPRRNWVRSNRDIRVHRNLLDPPGALGSRVAFETPSGSSPGILWARGDLYAGNTKLDQPADLALAMQRIGGQISSRSLLRNEIYQLHLEDLKLPADHKTIGPGRYVVSNKSVDVTFTYEQADGPHTCTVPLPYKSVTHIDPDGARTTWYNQGDLDQAQSLAAANVPADAQNLSVTLGGVDGTPATGGKTYLNGAGNGFEFDFATSQFKMTTSDRFDVDGSLEIGYEDELEEGESYAVSVQFPSPESGMSAALNVTGDLNLKGEVRGKAGIAAEGDISLAVPCVDVEADASQPIVVYGKKDVNIMANNSAQDGQNFMLKLRGLVYAEKNLRVASSKPVGGAEFEGAIVARDGDISMQIGYMDSSANQVKFTFDPKYFEAFTRGLSGNRRRLRQASYYSY